VGETERNQEEEFERLRADCEEEKKIKGQLEENTS